MNPAPSTLRHHRPRLRGRLTAWIALLSAVVAAPLAQARDVRPVGDRWLVTRWTSEDGLPVDHVNDLALGADGRLWIATYAGLYAFDGATFEAVGMGTPSGTSNPRVIGVARQPGGTAMWARLEGNRIERLDGVSRKSFGPYAGNLAMASGKRTLYLLAEGAMWALEDVPRRVAPVDLDFATSSMVEDPGGGLWVASIGDEAWFPLDESYRVLRDRAVPYRELPIFQADRWSVWQGELRLDGDPFPEVPGVRGAVLVDGSLWLGTRGEGLLRIQERVLDVVLPGEGVGRRIERLAWDVPSRTLWARSEYGAWWSVTDPLRRLDPPVLRDSHAPVLTLPFSLDGVGRWWAHRGQVYREDPRTRALTMEPEAPGFWQVPEAWSAPDGSLWLGTDFGVFVHQDGRWRHVVDENGDEFLNPRSFESLPDGSTVVGCKGGLAWVDPKGLAIAPRAPFPVTVRHVRRDGAVAWLSTEEQGLCAVPVDRGPQVLSREDAWRCLRESDGLGTYGVHASIEDGLGRTWVSANRGIGWARSRRLAGFAAGDLDYTAFVWLGREDGMRSAEANGAVGGAAVRTVDGDLWFPTQEGVVRVYPDRVGDLAAPAVRFTSVQVDGKDASTRSALEVPSRHGFIEIHWAASSLDHAQDLVYRYHLGQDPWSAWEPRTDLLLSHLPPGTRPFEVQAALSDLVGPVASVSLTRPFELRERPSTWATLVAGLAVLGLTGLFLRIRGARLREAELTRRVDEAARRFAEGAALLERRNLLLDEHNIRLREQAEELRALHAEAAAQAERLTVADRLKRTFLANVSHELRTPLALVIGPLGAVLEGLGAGPTRASVEIALRNAERLQRLVGQLLDVARAQGGALPFRARRVRLGALVQTLLQRFPPPAADGTLEVRLPDPDPLVWCDPDLVDTMLGNLVANAREHGGGRVRVSVDVDDGDGGRPTVARVTVRDHGPGVPPGAAEAIFERFNSGSGEPRRSGLGLGLSLVRELAHLHGGEAGLDSLSTLRPAPRGAGSPADGGAAFWFTLPLGVEHIALEDVDLSPHPGEPAAVGEPVPFPAGAPACSSWRTTTSCGSSSPPNWPDATRWPTCRPPRRRWSASKPGASTCSSPT